MAACTRLAARAPGVAKLPCCRAFAKSRRCSLGCGAPASGPPCVCAEDRSALRARAQNPGFAFDPNADSRRGDGVLRSSDLTPQSTKAAARGTRYSHQPSECVLCLSARSFVILPLCLFASLPPSLSRGAPCSLALCLSVLWYRIYLAIRFPLSLFIAVSPPPCQLQLVSVSPCLDDIVAVSLSASCRHAIAQSRSLFLVVPYLSVSVYSQTAERVRRGRALCPPRTHCYAGHWYSDAMTMA